ncbi:hypothetical protein [Sorangium sp. So ce388]|uniref:hypothetical protein n=1 Tax=Sorangium sp. So ce388 TaxID=3133309 RepID=UPI003F5BFD5A
MTLDVLTLAASIDPGDLAAIQAHAEEIVADELRDSERFVGPERLYRLEHTATLHLVVAGLLLREVEALEAQPIEIVSAGRRRRCSPIRRWHGRLRTLAFVATQRRRGRRTRLRVRCRCACGQIVTVLKDDLARGKVRSCGCRRDEMTADRNRERAEQRRAA